MNKLRYRIVFNKARGMLMAVGECARSCSKGAGQTGVLDGSEPAAVGHPALRRLTLLFGAAFGGFLWASHVQAQIVADPKAPNQNQAIVLKTANGVPQVDVRTPSAAGVSRNVYSQFDVARQGAILNNSRANVQTELGGWVEANPWLKAGGARVILNEVNSSNPSSLKGFIEVAGQKAEVVIANPSGIAVDGGGFINVSRATLTTGSPIMVDGRLTGYDVQRGQIAIDGAGLDASRADYTALISRSVSLNAALWAQRLNVITGVNKVDEGDTATVAEAKPGAGSAPSFAIDVSRLGGMYANQIYMIGTEAGVGVRNAGEIGAAAGELVVTSSGRLENTGSLAASKALRLQANDAVANDGTSYAREAVQVTGASFSNSGTLRSDGTVQLTAAGKLENSGSFSGQGDVQLKADSLTNHGAINSGGRLSVALQGDADNRQASIQAESIALDSANGKLLNQSGKFVQNGMAALDVTASALHNTNGGLVGADASTGTGSGSTGGNGGGSTTGGGSTGSGAGAGAGTGTGTGTGSAGSGSGTTPVAPVQAGWVHVAGAVENDAGQLLSSGPVNLSVTSLDNVGSKMTLGSLAINGGALDNHGGSQLSVESGLSLHIPSLDNRGSQLQVGGNFSGDIQSFDNTAGLLSAGGDLQLHTSTIANHGGQLAAGGRGTLAADGAFDNSSGKVFGGSGLTVSAAGALDNTSGKIETAGTAANLQLQAASINNTGGRIASSGAASLATSGNIGNSNGLISSQDNLSITAADLSNTVTGVPASDTGIQSQAGNVQLGVQHLSNSAGVYAGKELNASATALDNSGTLYAGTRQNLTVNHAVANSGTIAAAHDLTVTAGSLGGTAGSVLAAGMASNGQLTGAGGLLVTTSGALQTAGQAMATDNVILKGANLDLAGSSTGSTAGNVSLTAQSGHVVTRQAQVSTPGRLVVNANQTLDNSFGQLSGQQLQIQAGQVDNSHGQIQQTGHGVLAASIQSTGALNNTSGHIVANAQDVTVSAGGALTNTDGVIGHAGAGQLGVNAAGLDNTRGQVTGNGRAAIASTGNIVNSDGLISAQYNLGITAADLGNTVTGALTATTGIQSQSGNVGLAVQHLTNNNSVFAGQDLNASATTVDNSGTLYAGGQQNLSASNAVTNSGTIAAGHDVTVSAGSLSGAASSILAAGMASNGQLSGAGALSVTTTGALQTAGQALATGNVSFRGASLDLANSTTGSIGGDVSLTAQSGDLVTSHAQVSTPGQLTINASQLLDNSAGQLTGKQLQIQAGQMDNSHGQIQQTGPGAQAASIQSTGALNNSSGHILANAQDFTVSAGGAITNTDGVIGHAGAGQLTVNAGGLDNTRGQVIGNGQAVLASTGNIVNSDGLISAQSSLDITGADLSNTVSGAAATTTGIQNQAGDVHLNVQHLTNSGNVYAAQDLNVSASAVDNSGTLYAAGREALSVSGAVNNSGTIAAAHDLTVDAGSLGGTSTSALAAGMASNGQLSGAGALSVTTTGALQTAGHVLATGNVTLKGASVDLANSTTGSTAGNVTLTAQSGNLATSHAQVSTPGQLTVNASQALDNSAGQLTGQQVQIHAGQLNNSHGQIQQTGSGAQAASIQSAGALNNSGGHILANAQDLTVTAGGALTNTDGVVGHAGAGQLTVNTGSLDNTRGQVTGNGQASLTSSGNIVNSDGLIAAQNSLNITGADLSNTASGGASTPVGIQNQAGDVHLSVQHLTNSGSVVAAQDLIVSASAVDNSGTLYAADQAVLSAGGAVNSSGTIAAAHDLTVNAGSLAGAGSSVLAAGMANNGQLTGAGALSVTTTGALQTAGQALATGNVALKGASLDLANSTTGSTGGNVSLTALSGNLSTRHAQVSTPGQLTVNANQTLDNTTGQLTGQQLQIQAGQLNNSQGQIQQTGSGAQTASIQSAGVLNNSAGRILANAQNFTLNAGGALTNIDGLIGDAGTGQLTVNAGSVDNTRGQIVGNGAATLSSTGAVNNSSGLVSAQQGLDATAAGWNNSQGKLVSVQNSLSLHTTQNAITNTNGLIQAAQDLTLTLDGAGNILQNTQGQIVAGHDATLSSGSLVNDSGLATAGHNLHVDTHGQSLSNLNTHSSAAPLGLVAGGQVDLQSGAVDNRAGLISAQAALNITSSGAVNNASNNGQSGQLYSGSSLSLHSTGLDNTGSQVLAVQDATIALGGGQLNNSSGLVRVGQTLNVQAASVKNTGTLALNPDNSPKAMGLEANVANITTANLDNTQGAVRAGQDLTIHSDGQVSNNSGELSAGRALRISADQAATPTLSLSNNAGQIVAGQSVDVRTGSVNGAGSIASQGDVSLSLQGDYTVNGTLQAGGNLQLQATGTITNPTSLQAGNNLTVNAAVVDNQASGQILSGQTTTLNASGSIVNRGLIDGADSRLTAGALANLGTGRIYGDRVAINAGTVNNVDEGGTSATIAGRQRVDIGAANLSNREGALIYSGGDMAIGGGLDGNWQANGSAQQVNNNSATIEAAQSLSIAANSIRNTDEHFATAVQQVSQTSLVEYQGSATSIRYKQGDPGVYTFDDESLHLRTPDAPVNGWEDNWFEYDINRTVQETVVTHSDPGKIIAGGGITLSSSFILNDKSQIVAGGALRVFGTTIDNQEVTGTRTTTDSGTVIKRWRDHHKGTDSTGSSTSAYAPGPVTGDFTLQVTRQQEFAANVSTGSAPGATARTGVQAQTSTGGTVGNTNNSVNLNNVSGTQAGPASGNGTASHANGQAQTSAVSSAHAQDDAITGNVGQAIHAAAASSAQAQGSTIAGATGQNVAVTGASSGPAQGNSASGQTAGQVSQPAGGAATGMAPGVPAVGSIVTTQPNLQLPTASLFKTHPEGNSGFLVETDPRFTEYKQWSSSDYMLDALQNSPATMQKRLGDGFYEQKLVREQVLALTGHRFLGDYTSDDQEYKALMDNGLTYAKQWNLRPGVALSPEQVAQLTSDIVWLVTQEVTLPDGSKQSVLVPQVYVRVRPGDVDGGGALLSGRDVDINLTGDVTNSGKIAGRNLVRISADNIRNMGGTMAADTLALQATKDIDNIGGVMKAQSAAVLQAGHDLNITTTTQSSSHTVGANSFSQTGIDRVAGLYVSAPAGVLLASAGNNINLTAAQISNAGTGVTQLSAGNNLNLNAVNTGSSQRIVWDANNHLNQSSSQDVGTQIRTNGGLTLNAGQDINSKAATVSSAQALNVLAGRDVNIVAGQATQDVDAAFKHTEKGFLSKKTITETAQLHNTAVVGSSLDGGTVNVQAGRDVTVKGSSIIADKDLSIDAKRNLSVLSVEETSNSASSKEVKKSGLTGGLSSGNLSVGYGKSSSSAQGSLETVNQAASSIGSLNGSAKLKSGETLQVVASDIAAKENLTLIGKNVDLAAAQNTSEGQQHTQSKSSGFAVGVTIDPLAAFKDAYKADTKNSRSTSFVGKEVSKAEGTVDGAMAAMTVATVQFGSHSTNTTQNHDKSDARTTSLTAGKDLTIIATDGSITSQGAQMSAEGNAMLLAKDSIKFDVAHNTEGQSQNSKTSGFSFDNRSAMMVGTLNDRGNGNGATDTVTGTKLSVGGNASMMTQTGDITLKGASVVSEGQMSINAARDLTITSAQDTARNANQSDNKAIGKVVISDTERFAGYHNEKHLDNSNQVTQVASNLSSLNGDVILAAGEKYTQTSSNVLAKNDVNITAKSIDITALQDTGSSQTANSDLKIGAFARISSPLIDLVNNVEAARKSDGRLKAMQGMAAAANGYQAAKSMSSGVLIKGEAGVGFASSSNSSNGNNSTAVGSTINGGGNVNLAATDGDIHATGATLSAGKTLSLDAAQNIVLDASQSTLHSDGKNHSAGAEVGVGFQVGAQTGVYVYASASVANGHNNSDATINNNTQLKGDTINIHSKGDTTLKGATATANTINADVGGKLAIESLQDTSKEDSTQTGVGARVQVGFGTWSASGNVSQAKTNGSSASVGQQSGLIAGEGGYHVKADTVDLKGGAITSTSAANSELTTNKLTTSNIENKMNYSASNVSMAGSISGDSDFGKKDEDGKVIPFTKNDQLFGDRKAGNVTPGLPMMEKGRDSSTTYATVTDGKITIGGVTTNSVKDLGINNDASKANLALDKLPDMQKLMKEQQAMSAAAGTVIATAKQVSSDFVGDAKKAEAAARESLKNPNITDEQKAAADQIIADAQQVQKEWGVGGDKSRALNVVTGILVGGVAGQGGTQIAANAAAPYAAAAIGDYFKTKGNENQTLQDLSHAVLGAVLAVANHSSAAGGALAGGGGELAAQILTKELYPQAFDANGLLQRDKITQDQANNITALSSAIGAMLSGAVGGSVQDAAIGGQVATNAVENNFLNRAQAIQFKKKLDECEAQKGGCPNRSEIILAFKKLSDANDTALETCITHADLACINNASKDIARESDLPLSLVHGELLVFNGSDNRASNRAELAKIHINDLIKGRELVCGSLSQSACDAKITQMKGDATIKALKLTAFGLSGGIAPEAYVALKGGFTILAQTGRLAAAELVQLVQQGAYDYCSLKPMLCLAAADAIGSAAAGVPVSGVPVPHLPAGGGATQLAKDELSAAANAANELRYLNNTTSPEIQARLSSAANAIRGELGIPKGGNVGFAEVNIASVSSEPLVMKAYSGYNESVGAFLPKPAGNVDTWILKPSEATSKYIGGPEAYLRDVDTEFKILETIAQRLGNNTNAVGQINLFSERIVCPSCSNVVTQFRQRFPNIQLNVFVGK